MANLADKLADARKELKEAQDRVTIAELRMDKLKEFHAGGTWYVAYPTEDDLVAEYNRRQHDIWEAYGKLAKADGRVIDLQEKMKDQLELQKAAEEAAARQSEENEKERQQKLQKKPEQKPETKPGRKPQFTPG